MTQPEWLTPDQYAQRFPDLFTRRAFRLEQLDHYTSPDEASAYARFLADQPDDLRWRQPWTTLVTAAVTSGRTMERVHVVTEPWTPYTRFELTRVYPVAADAGEDIRITTRAHWNPPPHDFWLVDDTVARMDYDTHAVWQGVWLSHDPAVVAEHEKQRTAALTASIPLHTYLTQRRRQTT